MQKNKVDKAKDKNYIAQEVWLTFFNNYLLSNGKISQDEYFKMNSLIFKKCYKATKNSKHF